MGILDIIINEGIRQGPAVLLNIIKNRHQPQATEIESESPEEAYQRIYGKPGTTEKIKLMAAQKAMEAVDQELKKVEEEKQEITEGTACVPCAADHFSTCCGILSDEAVRMARRKGIADSEVIKRILDCGSQLNAMEREDLSVEKIAGLPKWEKELAIYAQNKGAEIRHKLNSIESIEDLESIGIELKKARDKIGSEYIRGRLNEHR